MRTAMEHLNEAFINTPSSAPSSEIYIAAINSAREEAIRECAEVAEREINGNYHPLASEVKYAILTKINHLK